MPLGSKPAGGGRTGVPVWYMGRGIRGTFFTAAPLAWVEVPKGDLGRTADERRTLLLC